MHWKDSDHAGLPVVHIPLVRKEERLKNGRQESEVAILVFHRDHCDCCMEDGWRCQGSSPVIGNTLTQGGRRQQTEQECSMQDGEWGVFEISRSGEWVNGY